MNKISSFKAICLIIKMILLQPRKFFENIEFSDSFINPYKFYLKVTIPVLILSRIEQSLIKTGNPFSLFLSQEFLILFATNCLGIFLYTAILHLPIWILNGKAGLKGTFYVLSYSIAATSVFLLIPFIGAIVGNIWAIIIVIVAYQYVHNFSLRKSVLVSLFIPLFICIPLLTMKYIQYSRLAKIREIVQDLGSNDSLAKSTLRVLSTAAETYAVSNHGKYPKRKEDLIYVRSPYLDKDYCEKTISGYTYKCEMQEDSYQFIAIPVDKRTDSKTYTITTGAILKSDDEL